MEHVKEVDSKVHIDPCRLQVASASRPEDASQFSIRRVVDEYEGLNGIRLAKALPIESICLAWAVLLRSYIDSDSVSFGISSDKKSTVLSREQSHGSGSLDAPEIRSILQYHAVLGRNWYDWAPDTQSIISESKAQALPVNTAIRHCEATRLRCGLTDVSKTGETVNWVDVEVLVESGPESRLICLKTRNSTISSFYGDSIARTFRSIIVQSKSYRASICCSQEKVSPEDKQLLKSWHHKEQYSNPTCLHQIVGLTVDSKPNEQAICAWDGVMTYAELDKASTDLAKHLIRSGVQVRDLVPFSFEKSRYAVVAALAIVKAGAAFVPLDPNHPSERLKEIIDTVHAKLVVTSPMWETNYIELGKKTVVVSPEHMETLGQDKVTLPDVSPQDGAFVLFTSGSTGQPKGMLHDHAAAVTHAVANGESMGYYGRVFQFSAFTFDMAVWDMFSTLILGGCICIPSSEDRLNNISQAMNSLGVEFAFLTPSVASLLQPDDIRSLKRLACGGEVFRQEIIQRWKDKVELMNQYGIAEVGTIAVRHLNHDAPTSRVRTVGHTLPTLHSILVDPDDHDRLVPIGAIGELMVTGTSLSRGYINSETKNRSSFIKGPAWAAELGLEDRVFYKTGDLLQYNVGSFDGQMDFVKRKDGQLKYHGQRMEAGEVEHHLNEIPGVLVSTLVLPDRGCFSGQLVAAVQMSSSGEQKARREPLRVDPTQKLPAGVVKAHLSKSLPGYMIPAECVVIGNMPYTPSCKVDRKAVQAWLQSLKSRPDQATLEESRIEMSPLAEYETTAKAISRRISDMIAARDEGQGVQLEGHDFLLQSSGVDSIQTASLAMFVQNEFGIKLPISVLLKSGSTVRDVARAIDQNSVASIEMVDLAREVEFHSQGLLPSDNGKLAMIRNVFLTGASGYLGSTILQKLLEGSAVRVTVLTRCPSIAEASEQMKRRAVRHGWWREMYTSRIDIWQGDLIEPGLGLNAECFDRLCGKSGGQVPCIDAIIHNGAKVHYSLDYEALKAANLQSTKNLLSVASNTSTISSFVYISGGRPPSAIELSETEDAIEAESGNGYTQSKFVAEYLVRRCMASPAFAAKSVRIIRPGYIIGSPQNGIANPTDFIWRLIAGCVEIQAYNEDDDDKWLFISDVGHVADVATSSIIQEQPCMSKGVDQILDGISLSSLWNVMIEQCGYVLRPLKHAQWLHLLKSAILDRGESHLLFPLLHTLEAGEGRIGSNDAPNQNAETSHRVEDAIRANVQHLVRTGFLQASPKYSVSAGFDEVFEDDGEAPSSSDGEKAASLSASTTQSSTGSSSTDTMSSVITSAGEEDESYVK
ncbi:MAG: hypothetical protein Q9174_003228 [Haloplaca sp. 1 TL-2023]